MFGRRRGVLSVLLLSNYYMYNNCIEIKNHYRIFIEYKIICIYMLLTNKRLFIYLFIYLFDIYSLVVPFAICTICLRNMLRMWFILSPSLDLSVAIVTKFHAVILLCFEVWIFNLLTWEEPFFSEYCISTTYKTFFFHLHWRKTNLYTQFCK